jgi:predicted DNA-binding transcriptional regulator AlpA
MNAVVEAPALNRLLNLKELADRLSVSTRSVFRWTAEGRLPRPINVTKRSVRWDAAEVAEAVEKLAARA